MWNKNDKKMKLNESIELVKFYYDNHSKKTPSSKRPRVKVLDFEYPGRPGQKTYNQRKDLLGWNLNYFSNKKYASRAIDEIDSFARLLSADNKEKYKRIKHLYPEQASFLRRYQRKHIKGIRRREGLLWKKTDFNELINFNKERF
jgi:hypothetical protein